jgi:S-adenosylmethionine:tRNA ribosyltransferase-isomerase
VTRDADTAPPLDLSHYDYELPAERIAQQPLPERDGARLLVLERGEPETACGRPPLVHAQVRDLPRWLRAGDLLVVNATRVLPARLRGNKLTGGAAEVLLLGPADADVGSESPTGRYLALVKVTGRLRPGLKLRFQARGDLTPETVEAELVELDQRGWATLAFEPGASPYRVGESPLPPYIRRPRQDLETDLDIHRYQTVFARVPGAVAAPTAGLHMTRRLLEKLAAVGVERAEVVLHVGPGTFRPLGPGELSRGRLHREWFDLPELTSQAVARTRARGGRVVAVGTTTARVLETCARSDGSVTAQSGHTELFLRPGSSFRAVDALLTNFHLPRSSLLLLVAAFAGRDRILAAYREAVARSYRFYSYGDAMLIL